jgi:hypothetical protein
MVHWYANLGRLWGTQALAIDPKKPNAALNRDDLPAEIQAERNGRQRSPQEEADHQAIDRGEDEGMIVKPAKF